MFFWPLHKKEGQTVKGLSLGVIPDDSVPGYRAGHPLAGGQTCTPKLSVETRFPGCQRGPDTDAFCTVAKWSDQALSDVDWVIPSVIGLLGTLPAESNAGNLPR